MTHNEKKVLFSYFCSTKENHLLHFTKMLQLCGT